MSKRKLTGPQSTSKRRRGSTRLSQNQKMLLSRLSGETHFVDLAVDQYDCNTTGEIALVATIGQGATYNQRVGRKVMLKSCQIRGIVTADSTTTTCKATWMLVYDKRPTGALPAITDILVSANSRSFTNSVNQGRFDILMRKDYMLVGNNTTAGQSTEKTAYAVDEFLKLKGRPLVFKAAGTGAINDIEEGALYIISVGDVAAGTADGSAILGFRTRFVDA